MIRIHTIVWVLGRVGGITGYIKDCALDSYVGWVRIVGACFDVITTKLAGLSSPLALLGDARYMEVGMIG